MNIKRLSLSAASIMAISVHSISTYAAAPELCFQSTFDYQIYRIFGDKKPESFDEDLYHVTPPIWGMDGAILADEAVKHGPARKKEIVIHTEATYDPATKMITLDASRSTTPSGQIAFAWGDPADPMSTGSRVSSKGSPGSTNLVPLTVSDPICETRVSKNVSSNAK